MTIYTGMGSSASLRGGAALGSALQEHPDDLDAALGAWEAGLRPFITQQQDSARLKQHRFVPSNRVTEVLRSAVIVVVRGIMQVQNRLAAKATAPPAPSLSGRTR